MIKTYKVLLSFFLILISGMGFSQSVPSYVPTSGLVGWWGFNGNAQDGSGNGNHGTVNGAILTTDRFGNQNSAYDFDGVDDWISITNSSLVSGNQLTVSCWVRYSAGNYGYIISTGNQNDYTISQDNSTTVNTFVYASSSLPTIIAHNVPNSNNIWRHILMTYDGVALKTYINGTLIAVDNASGNIYSWQPDHLTFGTYNLYGDPFTSATIQFYNGNIDEIGIWNRALTPQEITNLYNSQLPTQTSLCLPTITTTSPSSVGVDTVVIGGGISNDGGSSIVLRGICYSTSTNPNMGDQRTEDGSGTGSFNTVLRGLTSSTTYYARSYAKNSNGVVVYGNEVNFTTSVSLPGVRCPGTRTVTDIDGNVYNTVQIGNQCWTQSNLKTTRYRNGDTISAGLIDSLWANTTSGAYAIYNNEPVNDGLYGKLYNNYSVTDSRGLCPIGWHVPSEGEWDALVGHVGGYFVAGGSLKSMATQPTLGGWTLPNIGATNSSGFTALPGGVRSHIGEFYAMLNSGCWWSLTPSSIWPSSFVIGIGSHSGGASWGYNSKECGFSVRCLKNTLPQVNTTSVTNVTPSNALVTGEVISDGGDQNTTRGFCYSTISNPTISNDTTMNGSGLGVFTEMLQNLTPSTTYYFRAYATNSAGTSYGSELSFTTDSIRIGSNYAGGIVFYVDSTGQHGLVCAPSDQGGFQWGCVGADIMGTSEAIGAGQSNTNLILSGCSDRPIAASVCDDLVLNGHNDWYLSSNQELILMYQNLRTHNVGNFSNEWYRSSSQFNSVDDWGVHFNFGYVTNLGKANGSYLVRAVRAF
jgi:uncharacterized protein (TIGR02145 family)